MGTPAEEDLDLLSELGASLLAHGLPMARVEESLQRVGSALGREVTSFGTPTGLIVQTRGSDAVRHRVVRTIPRGTDLGRLCELHSLVAAVESGAWTSAEAREQVARLDAAPPTVAGWSIVVLAAAASAAAALLLGADGPTLGLALALGSGVGGLQLAGRRWPSFGPAIPVLAALFVATGVALVQRHVLVDGAVATLAGVMMPLPGLSLTIATSELGAGHIVSGAARFVAALFTLLQLGTGVVVGSRWAGDDPGIVASPPGLWQLAVGAIAAGLAFALVFSVPRRELWLTVTLAMVAVAAARTTGPLFGAEGAALLAATVVGCTANVLARIRDRPASVYQLPALVMLVPGSMGFLSISAMLGGDALASLQTAMRMLLVAIALSTGLVFASATVPSKRTL